MLDIGPFKETNIETSIVRYEHRVATEFRPAGQYGSQRWGRAHHGICDAGEHLHRSWDRSGWADEGLKFPVDAAPTHFHGPDLGNLGVLAGTGSFEVDDAERGLGQGSA